MGGLYQANNPIGYAQVAISREIEYEMGMFSPEKIQGLVEAGLPGSKAMARDTTGTSDHFELIVVSSSFAGKGMVERHRMVYGVLGPAVGAEIHALSLKTFTPEEAQKRG